MGLSYKKSSVPTTLREGEFAVVDGVTYVGNSDDKPISVNMFNCDYIITKRNGTYYALSNNLEPVYGSDFATVFQQAHDNIPKWAGEDGQASDSGGSIGLYQTPSETPNYFKVSKTINITKRIEVIGFGNAKRDPVIQLDANVDEDMFHVFKEEGDTGYNVNIVTFRRLRIVGNKSNNTLECNAFVIDDDVNEFTFDDVEIRSFTGYAVKILGDANSNYNTITNCYILDCDLGGVLIDVQSGSLRNLLITNNHFAGTSTTTKPAVTIVGTSFQHGCVISNNTLKDTGVLIKDGGKNWSIVNNTCWAFKAPTYFVKIEDATSETELNGLIALNSGGGGWSETPIQIGENNSDIQIFDNKVPYTIDTLISIADVNNNDILIRQDGVTNYTQKATSFEVTENGGGITLLSPDGTSYVLTVDTSGNVVVT